MRVAVIADIHGSVHALEAALHDAEARAVDEIVIAGDTVNILPGSKTCWERVTGLGCPVLKGNHEHYLYTCGTPAAPPEWTQERFKGLWWLREQFSDAEVEAMRTLPLTYALPGLLVTHASPRNPFATVEEGTPAERLRELFEGVAEPLIVRGHNHRWYENRWDEKVLVSVSSCGLPLGGRQEAQYLLLEKQKGQGGWRCERRFVPYDREAALATLDAAYLEHYGPIGSIFRRELQLGKDLLFPFWAEFSEPVEQGGLTLAEATKRFLQDN